MDETPRNNNSLENSDGRGRPVYFFLRGASHHFTAFVLHGAHFVPYSFPLYPVVAAGRALAARVPRFASLIILVAYIAGILAYANSSYFFKYSYVLAANPVFFWLSAAAGLWAMACAAMGRYFAAYFPFITMIILNIVLPNSILPLHRVIERPGLSLALIVLLIAVNLKFGLRRGWPVPAIAAAFLIHTGNNILPLIVAMFSLAAVFKGLRTGIMHRFNPMVHGFSVFHLLLVLGLSQFYSNSLPGALDGDNIPASVTPVHIYGSRAKNLPRLANNDNRFLSADPSGKYLLFGTRRTKPDLFRINRENPSDVVPSTIGNTADNIVFTLSGRHFVAGSFGRQTLEKIRIENFNHDKTTIIPNTPIRLGIDPARGEIFVISEFSGGMIYVYDSDTMRIKRSLRGGPDDRNFRDLAVDPASGLLLISQWLDLVLYDSKTFEELSRIRTSNRGLGRLAIDNRNRIAYLTHTNSGKLLSFGYENDELKKTGDFDLGIGIRDIAYDPVHNRVATANYFSGVLTLFDPDRKEVVFRVSLGNRMRHVEFADFGKNILTTTMSAGFIIDIDSAISEYESQNEERTGYISSAIISAFRMTSPPQFFNLEK